MNEMIENTGMDRQKLKTFILETYPASVDRPWLQYPNYEVFRHNSNQKWFAVIMDLPNTTPPPAHWGGADRRCQLEMRSHSGRLAADGERLFSSLSYAEGQLDYRCIGWQCGG